MFCLDVKIMKHLNCLQLNGVINVMKPTGMTSFDVVAFMRRLSGLKKIGHTGTLDPDACGVLPICIGKATKVIDLITAKDKWYRAEMMLGIETDTQDSSGNVVAKSSMIPSDDQIIRAMKSFVGSIEQIPPMFSAIKVEGKKLYELARQGMTIERKARQICVFALEIISIHNNRVLFDVHCSKGTYIRTLCHDIGVKLGCGAHMSFLIRTSVGNFTMENSKTLEELQISFSNGDVLSNVISLETILEELPKLILNSSEEKLFITTGRYYPSSEIKLEESIYTIESLDGKCLAIGKKENNRNETFIKTYKSFFSS